MVVSKKLVVVVVFCLYGIIHGKQVEDVESIADMKKILDRVLDEVTHLRLENKNMKSDNNNLQMKLKELDKSQTELLHKCRNVEKGNNKLNEKVRRLSILVHRQCNENNFDNEDPHTLQTNLDKYPNRLLPDHQSVIDPISKRLLLNIPTSSIVAFSVVLDHEATLGPLQVVKYNKILTNVGNVYDPRHGHANIPIKGIYLVAVSSMNHINEDMHVELVRNDDVQGSMYTPAGQSLESMSQTLVLSLEKSDLVWVRVHNSKTYTGHRLYGTPAAFYNSFSAILLFPL